MTELESKQALFQLHQEYMTHTPEERIELYDEYKRKRDEIKEALIKYISEMKLNEIKVR